MNELQQQYLIQPNNLEYPDIEYYSPNLNDEEISKEDIINKLNMIDPEHKINHNNNSETSQEDFTYNSMQDSS